MDKPKSKSEIAAPPAQNPLARELELIARGEHSDPFGVLGPHWIGDQGKKSLAIRFFRPGAVQGAVIWGKPAATYLALQIHPDGVFEVVLPEAKTGLTADQPVKPEAYRLRLTFPDGHRLETIDAYAFPPVLTDYDLYLFGEGTHYLKYEKLGAHVREVDEQSASSEISISGTAGCTPCAGAAPAGSGRFLSRR